MCRPLAIARLNFPLSFVMTCPLLLLRTQPLVARRFSSFLSLSRYLLSRVSPYRSGGMLLAVGSLCRVVAAFADARPGGALPTHDLADGGAVARRLGRACDVIDEVCGESRATSRVYGFLSVFKPLTSCASRHLHR